MSERASEAGNEAEPVRAPKRLRARLRRPRTSLGDVRERLAKSAVNAVELWRTGQLSAPYRAPFDVVREERTFRLRHYGEVQGARRAREVDPALRPVLLVPPLMVTSEVYDISPDLSAVQRMLDAGLDVWLTDFGAPEREAGGMDRTLDDHVRAVSESIDTVVERTGKSAHLLGYSQGGMFCYQVAAFRESRGIASIVTFGSPVDIRRNLPVSSRAAERMIDAARLAVGPLIDAVEGLPGALTATAFKLLSVRKEAQQIAEFVASLHDREKLEQRESRRRFLAGEGFVAWPGPAFRQFVDEFIVGNRMASGGFVIEGRTVTLADVRAPILFFVGTRDEIARPAAVRAIEQAAVRADTYEVPVRAGHFGLVVGSTAVRVTWPTVIAWVRWVDGAGPIPEVLREDEPTLEAPRSTDVDDGGFDAAPVDVELAYDVASNAVAALAGRARRFGKRAGDLVDHLRWQLPRIQRLRDVRPDSRISLSRTLSEQARAMPDGTFFLWRGRAFSYRDADRRVTAIVHGLHHAGVRRGDKVGVLMRPRPSYLSVVAALNRMGAVAVLLAPEGSRASLGVAVRSVPMGFLVCDPESAATARSGFEGPVLVLGGGPPGAPERPVLADGVVDLEAIDPTTVALPPDLALDDGRASDLAMVIFTAGRGDDETTVPARITNRRWAFSALGAAAACALTPHDTVYCCLPLHHAAGMLVAVGSALVGGSRLALADELERDRFVAEVHRYGATVVFYAGEMLRVLVDAPRTALDETMPVRLFAGSGMRVDLWKKLRDQYPRARVLEFYASTEGNAVLANTRGRKIGALGKPLPGSAETALVVWDPARRAPERDERREVRVADVDEPGMLVARIDASHPMASFDGYEGEARGAQRVLRDLFAPGDAWFVTGDVMRRDQDGDYWLVDRFDDIVFGGSGLIVPRAIEDALLEFPRVRAASVRAENRPEGPRVLAAIVARVATDAERATLLSEIVARVEPAPPDVLCFVSSLPMTDGYRPRRVALARLIDSAPSGLVYVLEGGRYVPRT